MKKQSIPSSDIQSFCNQLNAAGINSGRIPMSVSINKNSPFNPKINDPVQINMQVSANLQHTEPMKGYNFQPGFKGTALYHEKERYTRNAENVLGNDLLNQLHQREEFYGRLQGATKDPSFELYPNDQKNYQIVMNRGGVCMKANNHYTPQAKQNDSTHNVASMYNPMLMDSEFNQRPKNMPIKGVDQRLESKRNARPYLDKDEQHDLAENLWNSAERKQRLALQEAADKASKKLNGINRWKFDEKKAYLNDSPQVTYGVDTVSADDKQIRIHMNQHPTDRETFDETTISSKIGLSEVTRNAQQRFNKDDVRNTEYMYKRMIEAAKHSNREAFDETKSRKGIIETFVSGVKSLLGIAKEDYSTVTASSAINARTSFKDTKDVIADVVIQENFQPIGVQRHTDHVKLVMNRNYDKPLVIDGADEYANTASSIITLDSSKQDKFRIKKTVAYQQNGKIVFIQKLEQDALFGNDMNPIKDDLLMTEIPYNALNPEIRDKINTKNKFSATRAGPIELSYDDYIMFVNFIEQHPEYAKRESVKYVFDNVRGFDYDRDIANSFNQDSNVYVSADVFNKMSEIIHKYKSQYTSAQRGKEFSNADVDMELNDASVAQSSALKTKSRKSNPAKQNYSTNRGQRIERNRYNDVSHSGL